MCSFTLANSSIQCPVGEITELYPSDCLLPTVCVPASQEMSRQLRNQMPEDDELLTTGVRVTAMILDHLPCD